MDNMDSGPFEGLTWLEDGGREGVYFCYYCGGGLDVESYCSTCSVRWDRLYAVDCPACGPSFVHLHAPNHAEAVGSRIALACGSCWCDACNLPYVYRWWSGLSGVHLQVVGMDHSGETVNSGGRARQMVMYTS